MKFVYYINDRQVFSLVNAEGFMYLYFLRSTSIMLFIMSISSIFIMLPLFSVKYSDDDKDNISILHKLTVKNAYQNVWKLYIVLIFSIIYTILAYYHVYNLKKKLDIVKKSSRTEDSLDKDISCHTLHIRGINKNLSYDEVRKVLFSFFEAYYPNVLEIQVIAKYDKLLEMIDFKYLVEKKYNKYRILNIKNKDKIFNSNDNNDNSGEINKEKRELEKMNIFCGPKVDGEIYYKHWINITNKMLLFYKNLNVKKNTGNAFISFNDASIVEKILSDTNVIMNRKDSLNGKILNVNVIKI
jgi:hypothetical protein